ncbi:hypothetical protein KC959_00805, partial [Candidatus Saccharibacteria bacterium]|nr:hypothetical protein [Candidatus Saccharibacteria bacterium]
KFVLDLFADDVEYWETPFKKLQGKDYMALEWRAIGYQEHISLSTDVFNAENEKFAVNWQLTYKIRNTMKSCAGVYLIRLDKGGKCNYFMQVGEEK